MLDKALKLEIQSLIPQIQEVVDPRKFSLGLFNGLCGQALLLSLYGQQYQNAAAQQKALDYIDLVYDRINQGTNISYSFGTGLAGVGWSLNFLHQIDPQIGEQYDIEATLEALDQILLNNLPSLDAPNYGFVHGITGLGNYFLERLRLNPSNKEGMEAVVNGLAALAIEDAPSQGLKWKSVLSLEKETGVNIGAAHGMSGIVLLLCKYYPLATDKEEVKRLIVGAVNFILSQEIDHQKALSYFPVLSLESEHIADKNREKLQQTHPPRASQSRLAWCYGDMGIGYMLYQAGISLGRSDWEEKALEVLLHATSRKHLLDNGVQDMGLCHGTAGISLIFQRLFEQSGEEKFREASEYWWDEMLNLRAGESHFLEMAYYGNGHYKENNNLLEGITGIGLYLLSKETPSLHWDTCLLL